MTQRYLWEIASTNGYRGAVGSLYLTLHGSNGVTQPVSIDVRKPTADALSVGMLESDEDLGNIVSGRIENSDDNSEPWSVDFVRVTRLPDGRAWVAREVGICTATKGCPLLRFDPVSVFPTVPLPDDVDEGTVPDSGPLNTADVTALARQFKIGLESIQSIGTPKQSLIIQRIAEQIQPLLRELLESAEGDIDSGAPERQASSQELPPFLVEIFGQISGRNVPLRSVLHQEGRRGFGLVPGGRVFVTRDETEGFRLSGNKPGPEPGRGFRFALDDQRFDVVALDGFEAKRVSTKMLRLLFGNDWSSVVLQRGA